MRLMKAIAVPAEFAPSREHRDTLVAHAARVQQGTTSEMRERADIEALEQRFDAVFEALESGSAPAAG
jgi:hypothetical protein